ncbi:unnamed protein product [Phyllotreta striolata]|uniref:Uncharacterized protein n=1 Tax=Phyllotreta striolata TaxID=444603 RepID=A0A9N9TS31_PHYSR|nr:unnamed protein product [Phyllotreta striolata]
MSPLVRIAIVVIFNLHSTSSNIYNHTQIDLSKCQTYYSRSGTVYRDFFSIEDLTTKNSTLLLDFHFSVIASSDAHVLLAPSETVTKTDPVYEIVFGAGGNSFCDIRRRQKSIVKATIKIKGLLSGLDPRSFWIHVTKDGEISIGKENEEVPILSWTDSDPLPLKVISFSTWSGIEAKWYFDCDINDTTEIQKPMTHVEKLRRDLLGGYDPYVRPVKNISTMTNVSMVLKIDHASLNEHKAIMELLGVTVLVWNDEKLLWDPDQYGGITALHIFRREIWQPDLVLYNAVGDVRDLVEDTMMLVNFMGKVEWQSKVKLKVFCDSKDMGAWPKDNHTCKVILGFMRDLANLQLNFRENESSLILDDNSEWMILDVGVAFSSYSNVSQLPIFEMVFTLQRNSNVYDLLFFTPFVFISLSTLVSFWVDPFGKLKISIGSLQLLLCTIMLVVFGMITPHHVNKVPFLVSVYAYSMIAVLISIIIAVLVINLSRNHHQRSVPRLINYVLSSRILKACLLLKTPYKHGNLNEDTEQNQATWILLGIVLDRLAFLLYLGLTIYVVVSKVMC